MAGPGTGDGEAPRAPSIRSIPALRLHYANALLAQIGRQGPIPLDVLLQSLSPGEVEALFKAERAHRSPHERARQLVRYAREVGLVRHEGGELSLTPAGRRYVRAGDPHDVFATTPAQREILREWVAAGVRDGSGVARGVALTLAILDREGVALPDEALGELLARDGGMRGWREPRTFQSQGQRYRALAQDAGLLGPRGVRRAGRRLLTGAGLSGAAPSRGREPAAWIVRAGRDGRYEQLALAEGVCLIGWSELGALARGVTRERLKERIAATYGERRPMSVASQAGQVYRFVEEIAVGDLVVLPLTRQPRHVAVGRVLGGYEHRTDGPFAGTDAQHTRRVEWLARGVPYEAFDPDVRAAFGQQGTVSQLGAADAAARVLAALGAAERPSPATHLVLKWSARLAADTIERHVEVAERHGAVWWGRVSRPGTSGIAAARLRRLRDQLAAGVTTWVFLRGETTWRARLLAIATDRAEVEDALIPSYYDPQTHHSLWVKLTDFERVDEAEIVRDFRLASGGPVTERALGNQTPVYVRAAAVRSPAARAPAAPRRIDLATLREEAEQRGLRLPDEVYAQALAVLASGKHMILTGPPGTAKTTFATAIAAAAERAGLCDGHLPTTATADWTTYETIGGLRPTDGGRLEFEEGHFVTAIRENRWLLIDELNRSQFDRAFGQLFTVLSGHRVVLPFCRAGETRPLALVPPKAEPLHDAHDCLEIPPGWRIVATMNVFDKTLLFDMSFALMRRFGFVEVACPEHDVFVDLIGERAGGDPRALLLAGSLLRLRDLKDVGPAVFMDLAAYLRERIALEPGVEDGQLLFEAFYGYLLPQFEGIQARDGDELYRQVGALVGPELRPRLRRTLAAVLGLELDGDAPAPADEGDGAEEEPEIS